MSETFEWDHNGLFAHLDMKDKETRKSARKALHDATDDLARISSNIAPIKSGNLRQQVEKTVSKSGALTGEVSFNAIEYSSGYRRFNYALWTHEYMDDSQVRNSSGGTDGYHVGAKYLQRPLEGEKDRYLQMIAERIKGALD
jgi:hypothetical protein